jgi:hypothetical protein
MHIQRGRYKKLQLIPGAKRHAYKVVTLVQYQSSLMLESLEVDMPGVTQSWRKMRYRCVFCVLMAVQYDIAGCL